MSLPGVESARRRRASHGRSSIGFVRPPPLCRRSSPHPASPAFFNPLRFLDPADRLREVLNERAIAARHRLDERLRDPTVCTPHTSYRQHAAASIPHPADTQPRTMEKLQSRNGLRVMSEEKLVPGLSKLGGQQDDCPVCLDSFLAGQRVVHLPCRHTFHRDCIVPWLQNHCHCPSCRAKI